MADKVEQSEGDTLIEAFVLTEKLRGSLFNVRETANELLGGVYQMPGFSEVKDITEGELRLMEAIQKAEHLVRDLSNLLESPTYL